MQWIKFSADSIEMEVCRDLEIRLSRDNGDYELTLQVGKYALDVRNAAVKAADLEPLVRCLHDLELPPKTTEFIGLDGVTYLLRYSLSSMSTEEKFSWWSELPPEWQALQPVLDRLDALIYRSFQVRLFSNNSGR